MIEQQSTPDSIIAFRCIKYAQAVASRHYQSSKDAKYPEVFSIVLYHGKQTPYPYSTQLKDEFENPEARATLENLEASLHYLAQQIRLDSLSKSDRVQRIHELFEVLKESLNPTLKGDKHMPTIAEIWIEQGFERGIIEGIKKGIKKGKQKWTQQGMQQGSKQTLIDIANKMLSNNYPIDEVQKVSGLSRAEILNIKK